MPIKGLTDAAPRFTRAGHIRLGIKTQNARGSVYPEKSDHFIADFESPESTRMFYQIYGAQPKKITVAFAHETAADIFPQWYKCYGASSGLKCKGDGETAWRSSPTGDMSEVECPTPAECDFGKANRCKQMASLQFFIRGLPGFQVFQVNTTSWNSIRNINSGLQMLEVVRGDKPIRGVWVDLYLVPQTAQHAGKNVQIYVMKLDIPTNLDNLKALECALESPALALPAPDESRDEYLTPTETAPAAPACDHPAELRDRFAAACEAAQVAPRDEAVRLLADYATQSWDELPAAVIDARIDDLLEPATADHWPRLIEAAKSKGLIYTSECAALMEAHNVLDSAHVPAAAVESRIAEINAMRVTV